MVGEAVEPVTAAEPGRQPRATSAKAPAPVPGTGSPQSAGSPVPVISGAASRASGAGVSGPLGGGHQLPDRLLRHRTGTHRPDMGRTPLRTTEITATDRLVATPLVVIEFPAQRSGASERSVTMTTVSSQRPDAVAARSASSTISWAGITVRTPQPCSTHSLPGTGADGQP